MADEPTRCAWAGSSQLMSDYHDNEWGVPSHDDRHLFEMLVLEGAQAGLSWATVLRKRARYRTAFAGFDPTEVARFGEVEIEDLLRDPGLIRNRRKIVSAVGNARAFLAVQAELGSFATYIWKWVDGRQIVHRPARSEDVPTRTELSDQVSRDLKRRGFSFVGSVIVYSYLQSVGVVDDHLRSCPVPCRTGNSGAGDPVPAPVRRSKR